MRAFFEGPIPSLLYPPKEQADTMSTAHHMDDFFPAGTGMDEPDFATGVEDIIGIEDIVGYDPAFGVGVAFSTGYRSAIENSKVTVGAHKKAMATPDHRGNLMRALSQRHAAALTPRALSKSREYTIGFAGAPVAIAGGASSQLKATPQVPFKGRRLIIPSDVAGALIILNLIVGKNPVLVSADPVAARAFTELGVGVDLNMDTAQISQVIALSLQNTSGASVSVTPTMIGTAME